MLFKSYLTKAISIFAPRTKKNMTVDLKNDYEEFLINNNINQKLDLIFDVHPDDGMLKPNNGKYYLRCGYEVHDEILKFFAENDQSTDKIENFLDFACGFGRITRWLTHVAPKSNYYVCDIMNNASQFCADSFGAKFLPGFNTFKEYKFEQKFDMIWVGSLFTHLNERNLVGYFNMLTESLNKDGIIVFTLHGLEVVKRIRFNLKNYNMSDESMQQMILDYDHNNFGYANYNHSKSYGISISNYTWFHNLMSKRPHLALRKFIPSGWVGHQDLVFVQKK